MERKKRTAVVRLLIGVALLAAALFAYAVENLLPYYGIKPYRMAPAENRWRFPNGFTPEDYHLQAEKISVRTPDSLLLSGWFVKTNTDTVKGTVILLHGISTCKETQFARAAILANAGYNSIALDLRAHGESEGEFCTFGYYEKYDIKAVVDTVLHRTESAPVGIWGASLGGAIALQSMQVDPRIAFGIVESTFDEFEKVAIEYGADLMLGIKSEWLTRHVIGKSGNIAQFDPQSVKPVVSAAAIDRPILFMHGDRDDKIPIEFNRRNFEAVPSAQKQWITVEGARHSDLWRRQGGRLRDSVQVFLHRMERAALPQ